jgi:hypothetical protein
MYETCTKVQKKLGMTKKELVIQNLDFNILHSKIINFCVKFVGFIKPIILNTFFYLNVTQ